MKRIALFYIIFIMLFGIVSATPLSDFMSDDVTKLNVTINQNQSTSEFSINTSGYDWDEQTITYEGVIDIGYDIMISEFLDDFLELKVKMEDGKDYAIFEKFVIQDGSEYEALINLLLDALDAGFTCDDVRGDVGELNDFSIDNPVGDIEQNVSLEKKGNNFATFMDRGYGDLEDDYKDEIREIIEQSVYSLNVKTLIDDYLLPNFDYDINFSSLGDLNYTVDAINLDDIKLQDGIYDVVVTVSNKDESVDKTIQLILDGLANKVQEVANEVYVPTNPEVKNVIKKVGGLKPNTTIEIEMVTKITETIKTSYSVPTSKQKPSQSKAFKYLDITIDKPITETANITFSLTKSETSNPDKINLYVWEASDWKALTTQLLSTSATEYEYVAYTSHFSLFVIAEDTSSSSSSGGGGGRRTTTVVEEETTICSNGEKKCVADELWTCSNNAWSKIKCEHGCSNSACLSPIVLKPEESKPGFFSRMTGAIIGFVSANGFIVPLVFIFLIGGVSTLILINLARKKKS